MQNLTHRFLEICVIIEAMMSNVHVHVFIHFVYNCSFSFLNNSNCLRQIIKKAELCQISPKIGTLPLFLRVLEIFLLNTWLETGTSYACAKAISKIG